MIRTCCNKKEWWRREKNTLKRLQQNTKKRKETKRKVCKPYEKKERKESRKKRKRTKIRKVGMLKTGRKSEWTMRGQRMRWMVMIREMEKGNRRQQRRRYREDETETRRITKEWWRSIYWNTPAPRRIRHGRWLCFCGTSLGMIVEEKRPSLAVVVVTAGVSDVRFWFWRMKIRSMRSLG